MDFVGHVSLTYLIVFAMGLMVSGVAGGLIAGLLGVGGGIVTVPVLYHVLSLLNVDESVRMHIAVSTSLATIALTSQASMRAHHSRKAVDMQLIRLWAIPMIIGVGIGSALVGIAKGQTLSLVFACVGIPAALYLAFGKEEWRVADHLPKPPAGLLIPAGIGTISTMMGIGGGTIGVPTMTLCGYPIHRAVGTASAFGVLISIPGTIGTMIAGWGHAHLPPYSLGFVNLLGLALIAPASYLTAPYGAKLAHSMDRRKLRIAFAAFIAISAGRMLFDALK
jgi:uncharacterized membrane protein YfcA